MGKSFQASDALYQAYLDSKLTMAGFSVTLLAALQQSRRPTEGRYGPDELRKWNILHRIIDYQVKKAHFSEIVVWKTRFKEIDRWCCQWCDYHSGRADTMKKHLLDNHRTLINNWLDEVEYEELEEKKEALNEKRFKEETEKAEAQKTEKILQQFNTAPLNEHADNPLTHLWCPKCCRMRPRNEDHAKVCVPLAPPA